MINEKEAQDLMEKFISLREQSKKDSSLLQEFKKHERICIEKFEYLISMRTYRYKNFPNYDDLHQEGFEALLKAMKNYNPKKGIFFYWAHKYIETRISRSANLHTAIRYPLKYAKENPPHRESSLPILIDKNNIPDKNLELKEIADTICGSIDKLDKNKQDVVRLFFGLTEEGPMTINKVCKKMNISRVNCIKSINDALIFLKDDVNL